ncbi:MAG: hypothetical protein WAX77_02830 [Methylococcaceae bacterium]
MKHTIKMLMISTSFLIMSVDALAHDQGGTLGLVSKGVITAPQSATDYYQVSCYDDGNGPANYLEFSVSAIKPSTGATAGQVVNAQVIKGYKILNTSDNADTDAKYSPEIIAQWGNGSYMVMINKTKVGLENYTFAYHCMTADNAHTGTDILPLQNQ